MKLPLIESHNAQEIDVRCPLPNCKGEIALSYPDHRGLLVCASCSRTFDPEIEFGAAEGEGIEELVSIGTYGSLREEEDEEE